MFKAIGRQEKIVRNIRFPEDLNNQLTEITKKYHMPISTLVTQCCELALENLAEEPPNK